jgi:pyruvate,orthophosphate dikinase
MKRALDVNLQRTAVEVVIPEEHQVLLEITAPLFGVRKQTEDLLREVHHRYVGWAQTLADVHRRATSDFFHYNRHERGPEALRVFCDLYARIATEASPAAIREEAVRRWLAYLEKIATHSGDRLDANLPAVLGALDRLEGIFSDSEGWAVVTSPALKRLARALAAPASELPTEAGDRPSSASELPAGTGDDRAGPGGPYSQAGDARAEAIERVLALLAAGLEKTYGHWLAEEDPLLWYEAIRGKDSLSSRPEALELISHHRLRPLLEGVRRWRRDGSLADRMLRLLELPDNSQTVRAYLDVGAALHAEERSAQQTAIERVEWFSRILGSEHLSSVHEAALQEVRRSCAGILRGAAGSEGDQFIRDIFSTLRRGAFPYPKTVLELIARIGQEVLATGDADWVDAVIGEILDYDFHYPEFGGYTEEWGVRVNPAHLQNIRAYLAVVRVNPLLARQLLAALVVHLKVGGVFMADTDLFQRDISALLARDIEPVYHQVKQLLKLFPVYFNDIGAEGELREVSTRLDEICARRDPLCHFVRKQSHVESNPLLVSFVEDIARFWTTGDPAPLERYVPASLFRTLDIEHENYRCLHRVFRHLAGGDGGIDSLFGLAPAEIRKRLDQVPGAAPDDLDKAELLFRTRTEIARKYAIDHRDLLGRLRGFHRLDQSQVAELSDALDGGERERSIKLLLGMLEDLQSIILDKGETRAVEDIYHKRHIAVGIPSMYGSYREERFEAAGLTFRIESLVTALVEEALSEADLTPRGDAGLRRITPWLHLLARALRVDGCRSFGLETCISMLEQALDDSRVGHHQLLNVFQLISRNIEHLVRERFLDLYEDIGDQLIARMMERGVLDGAQEDGREAILRFSEKFYRDLIAETFGLQQLDRLVGRSVRSLAEALARGKGRTTAERLVEADVRVVTIVPEAGPGDGVLYLGNKGFGLKRLKHHGFPVPDGFIFSTDLFHFREAIRAPGPVRTAHVDRVRSHLSRLERLSGHCFGDPRNPLLLSVRGGAPISMPGMLDSFLNVGLDPEIAEGIAYHRQQPWAAWDAYRRFVQMWGMSHGIERDLFDDLIRVAKERASVPKKALLPPDRMKKLSFEYRALVEGHGVRIIDEPFDQLLACIDLVLSSWDSENARIYRREMQIAEDWGTAVIVQSMVLGNLHTRSGTGVVLSRYPRRGSEAVELYGDFIIQGQGDDVVSGLVTTFPITEEQREMESPGASRSLEKDFPAIYEALAHMVNTLILGHKLNHQEVEFTFESERPEDLYILQARDTVLAERSVVAAFEPTQALERARVATGIGAAGGALSGRVVQTAKEIREVKRRFPDDPLILLRPDTVPDDIPLVLEAAGMLTAIGGATSHAAVVAKRLGKTCVVGCRQLELYEDAGRVTLAGHRVSTGDFLSISGMDGSVYLGRHPVAMARVQGPARR